MGLMWELKNQNQFQRKWFSHKLKVAGLRHEMAVFLRSDCILWANVPFPCCSFPDMKIFSSKLHDMILIKEAIIANSVYSGEKYVTPASLHRSYTIHKHARARHEAVNERLKHFSALSHVFRHGLERYEYAFCAVLSTAELLFISTHNLLQING